MMRRMLPLKSKDMFVSVMREPLVPKQGGTALITPLSDDESDKGFFKPITSEKYG